MSKAYERLRLIAASPETHAFALALDGRYRSLLTRRSAAGCSAQELRQAFRADVLDLLAEMKLDDAGAG